MASILQSHIQEEESRRPLLISVLFHLGLFLFFFFGVSLLPASEPLTIGTGAGGGQGDFVSVGLSADTGGGQGMYKPPVTPRAETAPPPQAQEEEPVAREEVTSEEFAAEEAPPDPEPEEEPPPRYREPEPQPEKPGRIAREADPGKGERSGGGVGGGLGSGRGVSIGSGSGQEGQIDSWYIRQVEQRVGRNWLQTSLGSIEQQVEAVATFVVEPNGQIRAVEFEKKSGISSVDFAVRRAILASDPLPPLPFELRGRTVRFRAIFQYPQR